jgi:hypothetical protein
MFVKQPNVALKSILRTSEGTTDSPTLSTDLSILRYEKYGRLLTIPSGMLAQLAYMETTTLSPDPTNHPSTPFPWLGHVRLTSTSSVPMLIGQITPAIFQEALRRTPNHKATGPDGVPGLVLKLIMPPAFHEAIHILFHALAITEITLPQFMALARATPFISIRKGTRLGWTTTARSPLLTPFTSYGPLV